LIPSWLKRSCGFEALANPPDAPNPDTQSEFSGTAFSSATPTSVRHERGQNQKQSNKSESHVRSL